MIKRPRDIVDACVDDVLSTLDCSDCKQFISGSDYVQCKGICKRAHDQCKRRVSATKEYCFQHISLQNPMVTTTTSKQKSSTKNAKIQVVSVLKTIKSGMSDDAILEYLKQKDFNVNGVDRVGHSPFTMAAYHQKLKTLKYLKERGANIHHKQKKSGDTALSSAIYAAVNGAYDFEVVEYLLSIGLSLCDASKVRPEEVAIYEDWKRNQ